MPRSMRTAAALAALLAMAGCAGTLTPTPERERLPGGLPTIPAAANVAVAPGLSIARWWTLFGDAELDALVEQALQRSTDLAIAASRVREARARLDEVHGARLPQVELQANGRRARSAADAVAPGADRQASRHGVALAADHEIDLWGRLAAGDDAARARLLAQGWARASVEWSLTAQLAEAHFGLRALQRQIEIADAVRDSRTRTARLRQRELSAGSTSEFELRRAEAELAGAESQLVALHRQRVALEGTLALLAGTPAAELGQATPPRRPLDPSQRFAAPLPQGDAAALVQRRPDIQRAEAELAAADADVRAARAATMPALRLSGQIGSDARDLSGLFSGPGFVWALAAGMAQSVFDGGASRARVEQADARAEAALVGYRRAVATAFVELRDAYGELELTQRALDAERSRVAALERSQQLARVGVGAGALNQLELLDAERNTFQARLAEVDAYRDRLLGQVAAYKALGGGYAADSAVRGGYAADSAVRGAYAADSAVRGGYAADSAVRGGYAADSSARGGHAADRLARGGQTAPL